MSATASATHLPQNGAPNQNFDPKCYTNNFLQLIRTQPGNLKPLRPKTKFSKFWPFLTPHSPKMGPRIKILVQQFFGHGKVSITWAFENSSSKTEGGVLFSNFGPFRALLGHSPKTGPQIKILVQQIFGHGKVIIFWRHENPSSKTEGRVQFLNFGSFWAHFGP